MISSEGLTSARKTERIMHPVVHRIPSRPNPRLDLLGGARGFQAAGVYLGDADGQQNCMSDIGVRQHELIYLFPLSLRSAANYDTIHLKSLRQNHSEK